MPAAVIAHNRSLGSQMKLSDGSVRLVDELFSGLRTAHAWRDMVDEMSHTVSCVVRLNQASIASWP
jgi:hypothetical protein